MTATEIESGIDGELLDRICNGMSALRSEAPRGIHLGEGHPLAKLVKQSLDGLEEDEEGRIVAGHLESMLLNVFIVGVDYGRSQLMGEPANTEAAQQGSVPDHQQVPCKACLARHVVRYGLTQKPDAVRRWIAHITFGDRLKGEGRDTQGGEDAGRAGRDGQS